MVQVEEPSPGALVGKQGSLEEGGNNNNYPPHPLPPDPYHFPEEEMSGARHFSNNFSGGYHPSGGDAGGPYGGPPQRTTPFTHHSSFPAQTQVQPNYAHQQLNQTPVKEDSRRNGGESDIFIDEEHEDAGGDDEGGLEGKDWSGDYFGDNDDEDRLVIAEEEFKKDESTFLDEESNNSQDESSTKSSSNSTTNNSTTSNTANLLPTSKRPPSLPPQREAPLNGMSDEELSKKLLPDLIRNDLDILIIGVNPGIYAAVKGHHYFGPANHFCLLPQPMSAEEDYKLLEFGIGFTNVVQRSSRRTSQLTRKEIEEGIHSLNEKIRKYSPKIAVFNGKGIYEVFSGKKEFYFGKQPEKIQGTETFIWVLPNSSSRCAQLPSAVDKVPFYTSLKKYKDYIKGLITDVNEDEFVFKNHKIRSYCSSSAPPPLNEVNGGVVQGMNSHPGPPLPPAPHHQFHQIHQMPPSNTNNNTNSSTPPLPPNNHTSYMNNSHYPPPSHLHPPPHSLPPHLHHPSPQGNMNNNNSFHPMKRDEFEDHYDEYKYGPYAGNMESYYQYYDVDPVTGKKRRGRPPKPRTDGSMPPPKRKTVDSEGNPIRRGSNPIDPLTGKKKRGRPKKIDGEDGAPVSKSHKKANKRECQDKRSINNGTPPEHLGSSTGGTSSLFHHPHPHHLPQHPSQPPIQPLPPFSPNFGRSLPMGGECGMAKEDEKKTLDESTKGDHHPPPPPGLHHLPQQHTSYMEQHHPYEDYTQQYSSNYPTYVGGAGGYPQHGYEQQPPPPMAHPPPSQQPPSSQTNPIKENGSPEDVSSKSITGLESLVDQIPALENDSGVFSAGSHPATPRSVGPYSPVPPPSNNGYGYGSPGGGSHYGGSTNNNGGEYHPESSPSSGGTNNYPNSNSTPSANSGGNSERASPSTNSSNFSVSSLVHTSPSSSDAPHHPGPASDFSVSNLASSSNSSSSSSSSCSSSSSSSSSSGYHTDPGLGGGKQPPPSLNDGGPNNKYYPSSNSSNSNSSCSSSYGMYGFGSFPPNPHHPYYGQYPPSGYGGPPHGFNAPYSGGAPPPIPHPNPPPPNPNYPPYHHGHHPPYGQPAGASPYPPPQTPYF